MTIELFASAMSARLDCGNAAPFGAPRGKRRNIQNDALIGLTAQRHAATVVTANRADSELLACETPLSLLPV